jgi:hypothetical protein
MTLSAKSISIVFFLALAIRLVNLFLFIPDDFDFRLEDQGIYVNLGLSMLETGDFVHNTGNSYVVETERTPLYPAFLAIIWSVFGYNPWAVVIVQSILDSITCITIGLTSSLIAPRAFLLGGVLAAINMNLVVSSGMLLTDSLFLLIFTLFLLFSIMYLKLGSLKFLILLSLMLSISTLIRPVAYYLIPVLGVGFFWFLLSKKECWRKVVLHIFTFLLTVFILLVPLLDRNYSKFDTISITSQAGLHLSRYLVPLAIHFSEGVSYEEAVNEVADRIERSKQSDQADGESNPFEASRHESKVSIERLFELGVSKVAHSWIVGSTLNLASSGVMVMPWVRRLPHNSFYNTTGENIIEKVINFISDADSLKYLLIIALPNIISLFLFVVKMFGVYFLIKNSSQYGGGWVVGFILGVITYFLLITGPVIGVKYMIPVEPFLTVLAVVGFTKWKR